MSISCKPDMKNALIMLTGTSYYIWLEGVDLGRDSAHGLGIASPQ